MDDALNLLAGAASEGMSEREAEEVTYEPACDDCTYL